VNIYQLEFNQAVGAVEMKNVFHYVVEGAGGTAEELATKFKADVIPKITAWQSSPITNQSLKVFSLYLPSDFTEEALTGVGGAGSTEYLPLHDAVNFTMKLNTRAIRPGKKRFSGLTEGDTSQGWVTNSVVITALNSLRTQIGTTMTGSSGALYRPCVVKRIKETDAETGKVSYRMPVTVEETVWGGILAVLLNLRVTTQRSRR